METHRGVRSNWHYYRSGFSFLTFMVQTEGLASVIDHHCCVGKEYVVLNSVICVICCCTLSDLILLCVCVSPTGGKRAAFSSCKAKAAATGPLLEMEAC